MKPNVKSDSLNTFFDQEGNTAHSIKNIKDTASDEDDEQGLLHANSSSNGSGATPNSSQMNLSNQSPPIDTSHMSNQSKSDNLISNSFTQNINASASAISLKEVNGGGSSQELETLQDQNKNDKDETQKNE